MIIALLFVLCVNIVFTLLKERKNMSLYLKKGWFLGSSCGIMNGVVNLFVMILTTELKMAASVMFPVIGAGTLIITYIFYRFMFKEVLTRPQLAGFVLGTISVLLLNIHSCRTLEDLEIKDVEHGKNVVEYLCLKMFIIQPSCVRREEIELKRQTLCRGLQLAHHKNHIFVYTRVVAQVYVKVVTQYGEVHDLSVGAFDALEPSFFPELFYLFLAAESYSVHVDVE